MATDVVVPEVGEAGMDVVLVRWRKAAGDPVAVGDILFELDTEKTVVEVEAWTAGTLVDLMVQDGDVVAPRQIVARVLAPGEVAARTADAGTSADAVSSTPGGSGVPSSTAGDRATAASTDAVGPPTAGVSPRARGLAREFGIDPSSIQGTGPGGLVTEHDVRMATASGGDRR